MPRYDRSVTLVDPAGNAITIGNPLPTAGGGGGGGGAVTVAEGADVCEGATTDAAVTGDNPGTVSAKLRGINKILADVWDSVNHAFKVNLVSGSAGQSDNSTFTEGTTSFTPVGGEYNTTPGSVTDGKAAAAQITQKRAIHTNLRDATGAELGTAGSPVRIDPTGVTAQPVSATSLPLPTGASTESTLAAIKAKTDNLDVLLSTRTKPADQQHVIIDSSALPAGAATETTLSAVSTNQGTTADAAVTSDINATMSAKLRGLVKILASVWDSVNGRLKVDGSGVIQPVSDGGGSLTVDGSVSVSNFPATQPVSGTVTANQGTAGASSWPVKTEVELDYDTGAGTQNLSVVGIALPKPGGAAAGGTTSNPIVVASSHSSTNIGTITALLDVVLLDMTNSPSVIGGTVLVEVTGVYSGTIQVFGGGSLDSSQLLCGWSLDNNGPLHEFTGESFQTILFPADGLTIISAQATSWVSGSATVRVTVGPDDYFSLIRGMLSNNNAVPGNAQLGVLPAIANAADPSWTEGRQVLQSVDLKGNQRVVRNIDRGRTELRFYAVAAAAGSTGTETAITLTKSSGTAAVSSAASFVITNGKKFRITHISVATRGNATATAQTTTFNLRINAGGAVTTSSTPIILSLQSATPATSSSWDRYVISLGEGLEIPGDGTLQFGITAASTYTTNAPTWDVTIIGYEY